LNSTVLKVVVPIPVTFAVATPVPTRLERGHADSPISISSESEAVH
jgi:hypothetical protein